MDILIQHHASDAKKNSATQQPDISIHGPNISKVFSSSSRLIFIAGTALLSENQLRSLSTVDLSYMETLGSLVDEINGTFAVFIWTPTKSIAITDHGGSIPVFSYSSPTEHFIGTSLNQLVDAANLSELDPVSVAEFLQSGAICHPYTLYKDVSIIAPGTIVATMTGKTSTHCYWAPTEPDPEAPIDQIADQLRQSVQQALSSADFTNDRIALMYSGGEDSRVLLSQLIDAQTLDLICLSDSENREVRLARRAARTFGKSVRLIKRSSDHYQTDIKGKVKRVGAGFDVRHCHFYLDTEQCLKDYDVAVGGLGADKLLKSLYVRDKSRQSKWSLSPEKLVSEAVHLDERERPRLDWIRPEIQAAIDARWQRHRARLIQTRPDSWRNWLAVWPLAGHGQAHAQFLNNLRIGPVIIEPFIFSQTYKVAALIPDSYKLNRKLYRHAFTRLLNHSKWMPITDGSLPVLGGYFGNLVQLIIRSKRFIRDTVYQKLKIETGSQGPWSFDHKAFLYEPTERIDIETLEKLNELLGSISSSEICPVWESHGRANVEAKVLLLQIAVVLNSKLEHQFSN